MGEMRATVGSAGDHLLRSIPASPADFDRAFLKYAGPMFDSPIALRGGEVVERDSFVFADLLPA